MSKSLFPSDPVMTGIAIAFRNKRLIADEVFPYVSVGRSAFKYLKHNLEEGFTVPNSLVGRKSAPNRVEFSGEDVTDSCQDYFLDDPVPQSDIDDAPEDVNLINNAVERTTDLILLDREIRASNLAFDAAQYATSHKETLSGSDRFDDFVSSNPISVIMNALSSMIIRGNVMVIGRKAYDKLCTHPKIVKATHGNSGDAGIATRQAIASLFELDSVIVGEAFLNTAKKGAIMSLSRVWGNNIALICRDPLARPDSSRMTFGFTARQGSRVSGVIHDQITGGRGCHIVRVGETVKEVITSDRLGYLIQNVIS